MRKTGLPAPARTLRRFAFLVLRHTARRVSPPPVGRAVIQRGQDNVFGCEAEPWPAWWRSSDTHPTGLARAECSAHRPQFVWRSWGQTTRAASPASPSAGAARAAAKRGQAPTSLAGVGVSRAPPPPQNFITASRATVNSLCCLLLLFRWGATPYTTTLLAVIADQSRRSHGPTALSLSGPSRWLGLL